MVRDELQVWRVAQNTLDKQRRTSDKRWFSNYIGPWKTGIP
jgi:hypothetical protein